MTIVHNSDGSYTLTTPITAADLDALSAGQATSTPPPVTTPPTQSGFKGIFAFNTGNASTFATNPYIAGTELAYYWSQLEPVQGQCNWSLIDNDMKPWVDSGKKVTLRVKTAGWTAWQPPYSQKGTPQWVYDLGVPFVTDDDSSKKPQYWNTTFLDNLSMFVRALAIRYDGNANILAVEIGVGDGGETKPDTSKASDVLKKWQAIGYMDANWWIAIQAITSMYHTYFTKTPLMLMPDASFLGGTKGYDESLVTQYAAKYGIWLQWNGLVSGASLPGSFSGLKVPVVCEQLNAAGQNNRSFLQDGLTAIKLGSVALLAFTSDLEDPANAAALKQLAAMASK